MPGADYIKGYEKAVEKYNENPTEENLEILINMERLKNNVTKKRQSGLLKRQRCLINKPMKNEHARQLLNFKIAAFWPACVFISVFDKQITRMRYYPTSVLLGGKTFVL